MSNNGARLKFWGSKLRLFLPLVLRVALGGLFLYAGVQKARALTDAVLVVHGYALAPSLLAHPVALGITLLEITLGALLILGLFTRFAAGGVAVLALLFLAVLVQARVRSLDISCGCFGGNGSGKGVSWLDLLRELPMLAAGLYLAWLPPKHLSVDRFLSQVPRPGTRRGVAVPVVLVVCILLASLIVPSVSSALDLPQAAAPEEVSVSGPARTAALPAGSIVPDFSAPALYGGTVSWQTYRGVPTVLVLWAAWCSDCRRELPVLARVAHDFPGARLVSIVTAARQLPGPTPEQFMQSHHLSFPVALDSTDERLADAFGVEGFPTIYYVRADGTVSQATVGATPEAAVRSSFGALAN